MDMTLITAAACRVSDHDRAQGIEDDETQCEDTPDTRFYMSTVTAADHDGMEDEDWVFNDGAPLRVYGEDLETALQQALFTIGELDARGGLASDEGAHSRIWITVENEDHSQVGHTQWVCGRMHFDLRGWTHA